MSNGRRRSVDSASRPRRSLRMIRDVVLTVAASLGVLTFLTMIACTALDVRPLVFMSGSMRPTIGVGALAFAQRTPTAELERGDIVSVLTDNGSRVTHRIVAIDRSGAAPALLLKGDANPVQDRDPYIVSTADRVLFSIPVIGRGVAFIASSQGLFLLGVGVTALLVYAFRPGVRRGGPRVLAVSVVPLATGLAFATPPAPTWAYFTDTGTVTSGSLSSVQVVSQAQPTCQDTGNVARLTWSQVDARYEYAWELRRVSNNSLSASGTVGSGTAQGATVTLDITTGLIGANTNYNVIITARLVSSPTWIAASTTTTPVRRASVVVIGTAFRCGNA